MNTAPKAASIERIVEAYRWCAPFQPEAKTIREMMSCGMDTRDIAAVCMVTEAAIWNALARSIAVVRSQP